MCGVAGRFNFIGSGQASVVRMARAAMEALAHRGPDDCGVWSDEAKGVALAHTRLSILDVSPLGHQPMLSDSGSVALAYNGEIYNFQELRLELENQGIKFRGRSDTEVLLRLYESHRPTSNEELAAFLRRLNGIFAFALWDGQAEQLILARDALGVKPLYCFRTEQYLAFASELKALIPLVESTPTFDCPALHQYLSFLWTPGSRTAWAGATKVIPGGLVRCGKSGDVSHFQWYRPPVRGAARFSPSLDVRYVSETAALLRRAVHRQMVADVPVGAFLSGGLDSSSIVHFAREVSPSIQCFTIATDGAHDPGFVDDLPYAQRTARALGVELHVVEVKSERFARDLEQMVWHLDEPVADPAALNVLYISKLARSLGVKVLLSGAGGDDLFSGYRRHLAVTYERYWSRLPVGLRLTVSRLTESVLGTRTAAGRRVRKLVSGIHLRGDEALVNYFRWVEDDRLVALFSPELRAAIGTRRAEAPMLDYLQRLPPGSTPLERMLALEQRFFLGDHNLPYTDKLSMAAGVEVRVPFLDRELVEFAAQIPPQLKQRGRHGKWILRRAMEPYLPYEVLHRSKSGFGAPLDRWLRGELQEWIGDTLSESTLRKRGLFDPKAVARLIADNEAGRVNAPYTILSLACIEVWCRRFIDHRQEVSSDAAAIY